MMDEFNIASKKDEMITSGKELYACIKARDYERYKRYIDYDNFPPWDQDYSATEFERMCRDYNKEFKSPNEYFVYALNGLIKTMTKYLNGPPLENVASTDEAASPMHNPTPRVSKSRKIIKRHKSFSEARTTKARRGDKPVGVTPYGYRYSDDKKSIAVVDGEAATVKRMFSLAQTGKSIQYIVDALNGEGILTRQGKAWTKATIHGMLRNNFYIGVLTHQQIPTPGNHEAIISKIQFGKVQKQLERRHK